MVITPGLRALGFLTACWRGRGVLLPTTRCWLWERSCGSHQVKDARRRGRGDCSRSTDDLKDQAVTGSPPSGWPRTQDRNPAHTRYPLIWPTHCYPSPFHSPAVVPRKGSLMCCSGLASPLLLRLASAPSTPQSESEVTRIHPCHASALNPLGHPITSK